MPPFACQFRIYNGKDMNFILIVGPPAVGKMTVGQAIQEKLGYRLFHNHHSIELALQFFDYGDPEFGAINEGIRQLVFETVASSERLPGFIFTLVWGFDLQEDWDYVAALKERFTARGWRFFIVELFAPLDVRLDRNRTPNRLQHKPSKRDVERSERSLHELGKHQLNTDGKALTGPNYLRLDNADLSPEVCAQRIIEAFDLLRD